MKTLLISILASVVVSHAQAQSQKEKKPSLWSRLFRIGEIQGSKYVIKQAIPKKATPVTGLLWPRYVEAPSTTSEPRRGDWSPTDGLRLSEAQRRTAAEQRERDRKAYNERNRKAQEQAADNYWRRQGEAEKRYEEQQRQYRDAMNEQRRDGQRRYPNTFGQQVPRYQFQGIPGVRRGGDGGSGVRNGRQRSQSGGSTGYNGIPGVRPGR
jgi:hypothetical protein